jgi:hypothetical protein
MGAYHNALREEGSRADLIAALEKAWAEIDRLRESINDLCAQIPHRDHSGDMPITDSIPTTQEQNDG